MAESAHAALEQLNDDFFKVQNTVDPLSATLLGISGYDDLLPDPSRAGAAKGAARFLALEERLDRLNVDEMSGADQINAAVLRRLAWGARTDLEEGIWEADAAAEGYASPHAMVFMCVPAAGAIDEVSANDYLTRLGGLGHFFDALTARYGQANDDVRHSTHVGINRALDQLRGHLELAIEDDTLANPTVGGSVDAEDFLAKSRSLVTDVVRPAIARLCAYLEHDMLPVARDDEHVGICWVDGGASSYRKAVRRHTTTELSPDEIHTIGLERLESLQGQWSALGERVLGESDVPTVLSRLREDQALRFTSSQEIVTVVTEALHRAEAARNDWFPPYEIAECVIEEIHPIEAKSAALAHYRPPAQDGSRPGAHCVLTTNPQERFTYEYEALAFHESTPGHHLQIATAQTLSELPMYRRFLDAQVCGFVEGWGLYSEGLADEMGLYSSDVARLGMLSFDALRACRLVVDTGMHHLGWSRQRAVDFMWNNTATTASNVSNEIDRYIGWPGQALAYMIGRREIERLRDVAIQQLGDGFDVRAFHGIVLGNGAVPLDVLEFIVTTWIEQHRA
ncbi:MAG TPA: DUF885 domain-containing protein [Acidimicrobiales bacterium]